MKSYITTFVFTALLVLSGCAADTDGPETPEIPTDEPQPPGEAPAEPADEPIGEPTEPEEIEIEIEEPEEVDSEEIEEIEEIENEAEEAAEAETEAEEAREIRVEGGNYYFEPETINVEEGETVEFVFENAGGTHDMVIPELGLGTEVIQGGETASFTHTFEESGEFEFECSVGSHAEQGMVGTIVVE